MNYLKLKYSLFLVFFLLSSCISSKNIMPFPRKDIYSIEKDKTKKTFAKILIRWKNYPLISPQDMIGYTDKEKEKIKPTEVSYTDYLKFKKRTLSFFKDIGLYDTQTGTGTLKLDLTSYGRWSYSELIKGFLTETSFIYIIPRTLKVNYQLVVDIEQDGINKKFELISDVKTTFHILLFPLYPLMSFNSSEKAVLKNFLYNSAIKIYAIQKNLETKENIEKTLN